MLVGVALALEASSLAHGLASFWLAQEQLACWESQEPGGENEKRGVIARGRGGYTSERHSHIHFPED